MKRTLPLFALLAAALFGCGQGPAPSATSDAIVPEGGSPAAVTLSVAFPAKNALSPQGVLSTVNSVAVTVKQGSKTVLFDGSGNPVKTGGVALTLTPAASEKSVNLPTGPGYAFEFTAPARTPPRSPTARRPFRASRPTPPSRPPSRP